VTESFHLVFLFLVNKLMHYVIRFVLSIFYGRLGICHPCDTNSIFVGDRQLISFYDRHLAFGQLEAATVDYCHTVALWRLIIKNSNRLQPEESPSL